VTCPCLLSHIEKGKPETPAKPRPSFTHDCRKLTIYQIKCTGTWSPGEVEGHLFGSINPDSAEGVGKDNPEAGEKKKNSPCLLLKGLCLFLIEPEKIPLNRVRCPSFD
jgi:hypothetical protein